MSIIRAFTTDPLRYNRMQPRDFADVGEMFKLTEQWANRRYATSPWLTPTYASPWADYDAAWQGARYRKVGDVVEVEGLVKSTSNVALNSTIFTLPDGYRPDLPMTFLQVGFVAAENFARVVVTDAGLVYLAAIGTVAFPFTVAFLSVNFRFSIQSTPVK